MTVKIISRREHRQAATITVRSTRRVNNDALCLDLSMADWEALYSVETPSEKWSAWLAVWQGVIDVHMPLHTIKVKDPPAT